MKSKGIIFLTLLLCILFDLCSVEAKSSKGYKEDDDNGYKKKKDKEYNNNDEEEDDEEDDDDCDDNSVEGDGCGCCNSVPLCCGNTGIFEEPRIEEPGVCIYLNNNFKLD